MRRMAYPENDVLIAGKLQSISSAVSPGPKATNSLRVFSRANLLFGRSKSAMNLGVAACKRTEVLLAQDALVFRLLGITFGQQEVEVTG